MSRSERDPVVLSQIRTMVDELRNKRIKLGLSQTDLAELMGTSQSAISEIENKITVPTMTTLANYARAVGVEFKFELLDPTGLPGKYTHKEFYLRVVADVPNTVDSWQSYTLAKAQLNEYIRELETEYADLHFRVVED